MNSITVDVDGQLFVVTNEGGGRFQFDWVDSPNPGYGFSMFVVGNEEYELTLEQCRNSIENFLKEVDPNTGYIQ